MSRSSCALAALLTLVPLAARAQSGTMTGPAVSCSSGMLSANLGLAFGGCYSGSNCQSVATSSANNVLDQAECLCDSDDLYVEIKVTTPFPAPTEALQVWVGTGCDNAANRTTTTTSCERVTDSPLSAANFSAGASGPVFQRIPVRALMSPVLHQCGMGSPGNSLYFLFFSSSQTPDVTCSIQFNALLTPPAAPTGLTGGSGDGAVTLNWAAPPVGTIRPSHYQVLCADDSGNPVPGLGGHTQGYSACTASGIKRAPPTTGGGISTGTDDGGVATPDLGTLSQPTSGDNAGGASGSPTDGGSGDGGTVDGGTGQELTPTVGPFTSLDPRYICSDILNGTVTSLRIDGLTNDKEYQFVVVGIDDWFNAAPSELVKAKPEPVQDLYRRFEDAGGSPQGFCFIATAAYGSYEHPYVKVLRQFRDEVLLPTSWGSDFVAWYYRNSPPAADWIRVRPTARFVVRLLLWPVIGIAALWLWLGPLGPLGLLALVVAFFCRRRIARRLAPLVRRPSRSHA